MPKQFTQETEAEKVSETRNIVLIGFMGTGKSAVGRNLARRLNARHLDLDAEIERVAGKTIPEIFSQEGETAFRGRETKILFSLASQLVSAKGTSESLILSTGGGTPLPRLNGAFLKMIGTVVWLRVSPEAILTRVKEHLHERPLLAAYADDPLGRIERLLAERAPHYAALADYQIDTSHCAEADEAAVALLAILPQTHS